jgi:16S rRNA (cytosine967-C5)-methyltransferase
MAVSKARQIAFEILRRVEEEDAYASELLHATLDAHVSPPDAALATELTLGVLRWRRLLDFLLDRHLQKPVARLDSPVAIVLRMGAYQLRFSQRIPARAAVNESVELVKRARKSSAAALVNAVLRRVSEEAAAPVERLLPSTGDVAERLAILQSHPTWMVKRWLARWGEAQTQAVLDANNRAARVTCALHDPAARDSIAQELEAAGLRVEPGTLLRSAVAVSGGSVAQSAPFRDGRISIQDEASQLVPLLLGVRAGERVLDLCAAPGGKTAALARAAGGAGSVIAADLHAHRVRAMNEQFKRLRLGNVRTMQLDATSTLPFGEEFDAILMDAPCSGTGTLARHPEIRWRLKFEQLAELHALQVKICSSAVRTLKPGGRLVYSTCSLEKEENEAVVAELLQAHPALRRAAAGESVRLVGPLLAPGVSSANLFDDASQFRILPGQYGTDGFFAAVLTC